jgi:tripartite-type tricarboxylate transporter receptor subunit TctC
MSSVCNRRRNALRVLLGTAGALALPRSFAAAFPDKPIRLVVGYPPAGANDLVARLVAAKLGEVLSATVVVENRPGANGIIAGEAVAKAAPDGYTLLFAGMTPLVLNPLTYAKVPYDTLTDFTPINAVASGPVVIAVRPTLGASTIQELVALAKSKPGTINFATVGTGGSTRLFFELFKSAAGVDIRYVPYKGAAPGIADILGGLVDGIAVDLAAVYPFLTTGKLRGLGITTERRYPKLPDLPTMAEQGMPEMTAGNWYAVLGPAKMPPALVATLNAGLVKVVNAPDYREKLAANGLEPMLSASPDAFVQYVKGEFSRWGRIVKAANIQSE